LASSICAPIAGAPLVVAGAGVGQAQPTRRAFEQAHAELGLELGDPLAGGLLGDARAGAPRR
jgi:hypothetical protein